MIPSSDRSVGTSLGRTLKQTKQQMVTTVDESLPLITTLSTFGGGI